MILAAFLRTVAIALLRLAIWIAPHDTHDWGRGMLSELNHVEGNWSALLWAVGGAGVLAKHAMLALILPGSHRRTVSSASELFAKELPMRKATLTATAACIAASLLFFLAPTFRQAFQVSLAQWHDVLHVDQRWRGRGPDPELQALARKAEQNHDAEALAFVAVRTENPSEAARLAEEAVHLDSNLTWVYAIAGPPCPTSAKINSWVPALEQWDPQNALSRLIVAEKLDCDEVMHGLSALRPPEKSAAWKDAMAVAFQSPKLDTYFSRQKELDRRVMLRYKLHNPFQAISDGFGFGFALPSYGIGDSHEYAKLLLASGQALESRGDRKGAFEKYWAVARFGQMMGSSTSELFVQRYLPDAYQRLARLSEAEGNHTEAAFYASLKAQETQATQKALAALRGESRGSDLAHWSAFLVRLSGLVLLVSSGLVLICALGVVIRSRSLRLSALRPSPSSLTVGFAGAIGALLSSAVLYVSYRPYSEILQRFVSKGDEAGLSELSNFLFATQVPLGAHGFLGAFDAVFHFWSIVTLLCVVALCFAVILHFRHRRPSSATVA
ncbi:MAG TPA: hypothetical protein VKP61_11235 [Candidatus Acidoferrum sp.]|nr:hypothetical protein [Candidatus Acidoferrum sp.]